MKLILDTHIFLWAISDPQKIDRKRRSAIQQMANRVFLSSVSVAELMIKASIGKIQIDFDPVDIAEKSGFELLDFTAHDAVLLKDLPFHHKDPFDRMLITQSLVNKYTLVTNDAKFAAYDCQLL